MVVQSWLRAQRVVRRSRRKVFAFRLASEELSRFRTALSENNGLRPECAVKHDKSKAEVGTHT